MSRWYQMFRGKKAKILREDFSGTFAISCEWAARRKEHIAYAVDLDGEPLEWGLMNNFARLNESQRARVFVTQENVLKRGHTPKADVLCAFNFSYFIFKSRERLLEYFKNCLRNLDKNGVLFLDHVGGVQYHAPFVERTRHSGFTYIWELKRYDPIQGNTLFAIHYQLKGGPLKRDVFTYDWRLWSIPEIRECLIDAGFKDTKVFWEEIAGKSGSGRFRLRETGEESSTHIAYILGLR